MIKNLLYNLSRSHHGKLILTLFLFLFLSLVSLFVFYNGYLINFNLINQKLFGGNTPTFLKHVPYHSFSIFLSALIHPYFIIGFAVTYFPVIFFRKKFFSKEFIYQKPERLLVFISAFLLTWEMVTYDYNYYLGSAFYFDRIILTIITFALLRFPLLTPLYVALAFVYRSQFNYPVAGFELYDKRLLFDILIMFTAFRYLKAFIPDFKFSFIWLVLCIVASNYFYTGIAKIIISPHGHEWLTQNNISDLFLNVHLRGWLANTNDETIDSIRIFFDTFHIPLQLFVLVIELSALFLLRSKKITIIVLSSTFVMHLVIFICGSMLFWKWMAIDAVLIYLVVTNKDLVNELKYKTFFGTSAVIIVFAFVWLRPLLIGWFDTPANQFYTYEVEDGKGTIYQLEKNEMNPYHQWFQYDHFSFLVNKPCLPISGFGYVYKYNLFDEIRKGNATALIKQSAVNGTNNYDAVKTNAYDSFIKTYFANRNKLLNNKIPFKYLAAPHHLYNSAKGLLYKNQAPVIKFRVIYNLTFSSSGKTTYADKSTLHEISIPE